MNKSAPTIRIVQNGKNAVIRKPEHSKEQLYQLLSHAASLAYTKDVWAGPQQCGEFLRSLITSGIWGASQLIRLMGGHADFIRTEIRHHEDKGALGSGKGGRFNPASLDYLLKAMKQYLEKESYDERAVAAAVDAGTSAGVVAQMLGEYPARVYRMAKRGRALPPKARESIDDLDSVPLSSGGGGEAGPARRSSQAGLAGQGAAVISGDFGTRGSRGEAGDVGSADPDVLDGRRHLLSARDGDAARRDDPAGPGAAQGSRQPGAGGTAAQPEEFREVCGVPFFDPGPDPGLADLEGEDRLPGPGDPG